MKKLNLKKNPFVEMILKKLINYNRVIDVC